MARFNNRTIGDAWVSGKYKKGQASNVFFDGDTIYSYGYHFKIAQRVEEGVYLFNSATYSNSTSKQQTQVRMSLYGQRVFTVPDFENYELNIKHYLTELKEMLGMGHRSRKYKDQIFERAEGLLKEILDYVEYFKVRLLKVEKVLLEALHEETIIQPDLNGERLPIDFFNSFYAKCERAWIKRSRRK